MHSYYLSVHFVPVIVVLRDGSPGTKSYDVCHVFQVRGDLFAHEIKSVREPISVKVVCGSRPTDKNMYESWLRHTPGGHKGAVDISNESIT